MALNRLVQAISNHLIELQANVFHHYLLVKQIIFDGFSSTKNLNDGIFFGLSYLEKTSIPIGVTSIGNYALGNCVRLKEVTFDKNSSLCSIGEYAFSCCTSLKKIVLPLNVTLKCIGI